MHLPPQQQRQHSKGNIMDYPGALIEFSKLYGPYLTLLAVIAYFLYDLWKSRRHYSSVVTRVKEEVSPFGANQDEILKKVEKVPVIYESVSHIRERINNLEITVHNIADRQENIEKAHNDHKKFCGQRFDILNNEIEKYRNSIVTSDGNGKSLPMKRVLIVDDIQESAESTSMILEKLFPWMACTYVSSTKNAQLMLKEQTFDVVFIDLIQPSGMSGEDFDAFCERAYPQIKRIIYSGQHPKTIKTKFHDRFLEKPFQPDKVIKTVTNII